MTRSKLLLADASMTTRKIVELAFADEGIDVTTATDGASAMQRFVEIQPDIVLVDVGLSGTNGYRICEMIKEDVATRHIPVLLLVGSFEPFDNYEAERVGADGFLTKPFHSIRDLVTCVSGLLERKPAAVPVAPEIVAEPESAETVDIENLYKSSLTENGESEDIDSVDGLLGDSGMDDELIEASYPVEPSGENVDEFVPEVLRAEVITDIESTSDSITTIADTAVARAVYADPDPVNEVLDLKLIKVSDEPETVESDMVEAESVVESDGGVEEPSPEFISLVAQRVIERLSDKVIREVAQTAVPEIAEKLIREALEESKKD